MLAHAPNPGGVTNDFDDFFRAHHSRLVACGIALTGREDRARDAAQEAMTRAFRHWDEVRSMSQPGAWVRRVAVNVLIDEGRRSTRERSAVQRLGSAPAPVDSAVSAPDPVLDAVRALPERQRVAVVLHHLDDLSISEVAAVMNIAEGTVKATLFKARATLANAVRSSTGTEQR